jgi:hypothetical protein
LEKGYHELLAILPGESAVKEKAKAGAKKD